VSSIERRSSRRFPLRFPLTVRWIDEKANGNVSTESWNVSSRGVYFSLPNRLKQGAPVEIIMTLPKWLTKEGSVRVYCHGQVVRSSTEYGSVGVAASVDRYEISREKAATSI